MRQSRCQNSEKRDLILLRIFKAMLSACSVCQGYYGPNFGWPVCNTCHLFLFAADINTLSHHAQFAEKTDSGDSGTEEPNEETDFYMKPQTKASERMMVPTTAVRGDRLAERITNLSCPREYQSEKLDDGLIDSLPPEGGIFRLFISDVLITERTLKKVERKLVNRVDLSC
ncbi:hypothetical protein CAPTEDRAFT_186751 [Capitella teleta]|uniref:Uncharacterized protein n=1 Tax=Capitella teleta TaxID=283909 RepID=R7TX86_CAPTE|nr:hypothetical protein CAPTEDRAFT_186751 [Capitella teleta]|eukprot:ELT98217.1 hypothetical protein CAPTEDRAFT_186751 [Capitella teleta]